jgi:hypothetical protein
MMNDSFNELITVSPQFLVRDNGARKGAHDTLKIMWHNRSTILPLDARKFLETVSSDKRN